MSDSELDRAVKGAPPPNVSTTQVAAVPARTSSLERASGAQRALRNSLLPKEPADPTTTLPSSPPMIYLNLLILEASLRSQYLALRARRRVNTFFLVLLALWMLYFNYAVFLRPREDGNGVGGSPYWVIDRWQKLACMGGWVTAILVKLTGQWEKGTRWPQRWLRTANRGLRVFNCKVVIVTGPWWRELLSHLSVIFPYSSFFSSPGSSYQFVDPMGRIREDQPPDLTLREYKTFKEEDIAPGGDYLKLVLLPKAFSAEFRQNWDTYRTRFWEQENEYRAQLRAKVRLRRRELVKQQGRRPWWTGWRGWKRPQGLGGRGGDVEKSLHLPHASPHSMKERERRRRSSLVRDGSHSRSSSRSSIVSTLEPEEGQPVAERLRRASNSTGTGARRKVAGSVVGGRVSRLTPSNGSRPTTPTAERPHTITKRASTLSTDSDGSALFLGEENNYAETKADDGPINVDGPISTRTRRQLSETKAEAGE